MAPTTSAAKQMRLVQIILHCIAAAISVAVLSLSIHILLESKWHDGDKYFVHYGGEGPIKEQGKMFLKYLPRNWSVVRVSVLCATAVVCVVLNACAAGLAARANRKTATSLAAVGVSTILAILTLGVTVYVWQHMHITIAGDDFWDYIKPNDDWSYFSGLPNWAGSWSYGYHLPTYDPINWNCAFYPLIFGPNERKVLPLMNIGAKARVHGLCQEGRAAVGLTIPLLLLQIAVLGLGVWMWHVSRKEKNALAEKAADESD